MRAESKRNGERKTAWMVTYCAEQGPLYWYLPY
jgi:hypothetical protein